MLNTLLRPLFSLSALLLIGPPIAMASPTKPHVLIILADDMGYGDINAYNPGSKIPTPHLDRLAAEGMRFTDAHAPGPLCHVSRYGLMTGRFPFRDKVAWINHAAIEEGRLTLPGMLKASGYRTHMVGKWHLGFLEDEKFAGDLRGGPVDRGFDEFFGIRASTDIPPYFFISNRRAVMPPTLSIEGSQSPGWSDIQGKFWRAGGISPDLKLEEVLPRFTDEAVSIIEKHDTAAPLMLYLAYPAPHTPWLPSNEFVGKSGAGLYGDFTMMVDAHAGRVLKALQDKGIEKDTLVIFTSDNGPTWFPDDIKKYGHASAGPLRGMKADAWEGGHRMPFIVKWPGQVAARTACESTICFTDIIATLAEVTGFTIPAGQARDSHSFLPQLKNPKALSTRPPVVMAAGQKHRLIRKGEWKLITGPESGGFSSRVYQAPPGAPPHQLYHLKNDLGETTNLAGQHPEMVIQLLEELKAIENAAPK